MTVAAPWCKFQPPHTNRCNDFQNWGRPAWRGGQHSPPAFTLNLKRRGRQHLHGDRVPSESSPLRLSPRPSWPRTVRINGSTSESAALTAGGLRRSPAVRRGGARGRQRLGSELSARMLAGHAILSVSKLTQSAAEQRPAAAPNYPVHTSRQPSVKSADTRSSKAALTRTLASPRPTALSPATAVPAECLTLHLRRR